MKCKFLFSFIWINVLLQAEEVEHQPVFCLLRRVLRVLRGENLKWVGYCSDFFRALVDKPLNCVITNFHRRCWCSICTFMSWLLRYTNEKHDLMNISLTFTNLLASSRFRGALEHGSRLWTTGSPELDDKPGQWWKDSHLPVKTSNQHGRTAIFLRDFLWMRG